MLLFVDSSVLDRIHYKVPICTIQLPTGGIVFYLNHKHPMSHSLFSHTSRIIRKLLRDLHPVVFNSETSHIIRIQKNTRTLPRVKM